MITEEFRKEFRERVEKFEGGPKLKIYDDGHGILTIGVGFALIIKVGDEWRAREQNELKKLGINLSDEQYKIIKKYEENKSKNKGKPSAELKSDLNNMNFRITSDTAQKLLDNSINDSHNKIKKTITEETWNKLGLARQIGVMDHCFHHGNILAIEGHLKDGKFDKAADVMQKTNIEAFKARAELRADYVRHNKLSFDGVHIVGPGQTFDKLAKDLNMTPKQLKDLNPGINPNKLQVGQQINIKDQAEISTTPSIKPTESSRPTEPQVPDLKQISAFLLFNKLVKECNEILKKCFEKLTDTIKGFAQKQVEIVEKIAEDNSAKANAEKDITHANHIAKNNAKFAELSALVDAETTAKFAAAQAMHASSNPQFNAGPKIIDNKDIVAKYQKIYDQFCEQNKKECEEKKAEIVKKYEELAKQDGEKIKESVSAKVQIIATERESLVKEIQKILDLAKKKTDAGEVVNHEGIKQQVLQNANQLLEGANKHLGIVEDVSTPLIGLEGNEGLKVAA